MKRLAQAAGIGITLGLAVWFSTVTPHGARVAMAGAPSGGGAGGAIGVGHNPSAVNAAGVSQVGLTAPSETINGQSAVSGLDAGELYSGNAEIGQLQSTLVIIQDRQGIGDAGWIMVDGGQMCITFSQGVALCSSTHNTISIPTGDYFGSGTSTFSSGGISFAGTTVIAPGNTNGSFVAPNGMWQGTVAGDAGTFYIIRDPVNGYTMQLHFIMDYLLDAGGAGLL